MSSISLWKTPRTHLKGPHLKGSRRNPGRQTRAVAAIGLAAGMAVLFTSLGGVGLAQNAVSAAQGQYGKKVTLCHKGKKTISVGKAAVPAHLRHGDTLGTCAAAKAKKAKKAKLKAAKIKAAKAKAAKRKAEKQKAEKSKAERSAPETAKGKPEDRGKPGEKGKPEDKGKPESHPGKGKGERK